MGTFWHVFTVKYLVARVPTVIQVAPAYPKILCIYLETFSFSFLSTIVYMRTEFSL
jgi:hypothetical protein